MIRAFGTLGMIGGLAYALCGARMLFFGYGEDRITDLLGIVWAVCWIFGGLGLRALRVAGDSTLARVVSSIPIVGFSTACLWGAYRLIDRAAADHSIVAIAPIIVILGMLGVGVLTLRSGVWRSWQRGLPLLIALIYIVTVVWSVRSGRPTTAYAFTAAGICFILLGNAIRLTPTESIHAVIPASAQ
jgi:hypothetical protein